MKNLSTAALLLALTGSALPAHAASFDCAKARTGTEKAICAYRALNDLDVQMVDWLDAIKPFEAMGASAERRDQQRAWIDRRNSCGASRACLERLYRSRVDDLKADFQHYAYQYGPLGPGPAAAQ